MREKKQRRRRSKVSRKTRMLVAERDGGVCGAHSGGCGKCVEDSNSTIDHIVPRDFVNPPNRKLDQYWNLQVMCGNCNSGSKGGGGKFNGRPEFKCNCHYCYERPDGSLSVFHWNRGEWQERCYYRGQISTERNAPGKRNTSSAKRAEFTIQPRENRHVRGFVRGRLGYLVVAYKFYDRMLANANHLAEVGRWTLVREELDEFLIQYAKHGGQSSLVADGSIILKDTYTYMGTVYGLWLLSGLYRGGNMVGWAEWLLKDHYLREHKSVRLALQSNILPVDEPHYSKIVSACVRFFDERVCSLPHEKTTSPAMEGTNYAWELILPEEWLTGGVVHLGNLAKQEPQP